MSLSGWNLMLELLVSSTHQDDQKLVGTTVDSLQAVRYYMNSNNLEDKCGHQLFEHYTTV